MSLVSLLLGTTPQYIMMSLVSLLLGTTPQRREFSYPRVLSRTDRHSLLLKDFRDKYILNEAQNNVLPPSSSDEDLEEPVEDEETPPSSLYPEKDDKEAVRVPSVTTRL